MTRYLCINCSARPVSPHGFPAYTLCITCQDNRDREREQAIKDPVQEWQKTNRCHSLSRFTFTENN